MPLKLPFFKINARLLKPYANKISHIIFTDRGNHTLAEDIMTTHLVSLKVHDTYRRAVELLTENRLTVLPVLNSQGRLLGLLTEKEILQANSQFEDNIPNFLDHPIAFMRKVRTISPQMTLTRVGHLLANENYRHLPVVDRQGVLKGIITRRDLIRILYTRIELNQRGSID